MSGRAGWAGWAGWAGTVVTDGSSHQAEHMTSRRCDIHGTRVRAPACWFRTFGTEGSDGWGHVHDPDISPHDAHAPSERRAPDHMAGGPSTGSAED
ncbi:hypothetical protein ASD62_17105 [Phycicoccus sp. Root563]|nr:hypothetical protein ASD62_17105 [Phycicoccus sp. Root563]